MDFNFNGRRMIRIPRNLWYTLNCCVSSQSEIARVRIDRSLIGGPTNFRHIGHLGSGDLSASSDSNAFSLLLSSKGEDKFATAVPDDCRSKDLPVLQEKQEWWKPRISVNCIIQVTIFRIQLSPQSIFFTGQIVLFSRVLLSKEHSNIILLF